tara:strand:+ start:22 stop:177 length:156 start_codon:yes stop_codon:yes gene_type:complete
MFDFSITLLGDGALVGFTYFGKSDRDEAHSDEDWAELNLYFLIVKLTFRFW